MAGPVKDVLATSSTGRRLVSVKYAVSCWISAARMMPTKTARITNQRGLSARPLRSPASPPIDWMSAHDPGTQVNTATTTRIAEMIAEMKNPRLIDDIPERSLARGDTAKMPITAVITPIAGMTSGITRPSAPKAALPRMRAATSVTA